MLRKRMDHDGAAWAGRGTRSGDGKSPKETGTARAEPCTVIERPRRRWWAPWHVEQGNAAAQLRMDVVLEERIDRSGKVPMMRTDVRMNRWEASRLRVRRGSVVLLDRDVRTKYGTPPDGRDLRFGIVDRIVRSGNQAVASVKWRRYTAATGQRSTAAPRPKVGYEEHQAACARDEQDGRTDMGAAR